MNIIVFDLDGTLANGAHREHHVTEKNPKDWDSYFAACGDDLPVEPVIDLFTLHVRRLYHARVEIWTGRIEKYRTETNKWCLKHIGFVPGTILMRETEDRTQDDELKRKWLQEARARGDEVILVFEDRQRVVDMWREEGIVCCQVAKGDF